MANHLVFVAPSEPQTSSVLSPLTRSYDTWQTELEMDMDREFLLNGIKHGFKILEDPKGEVTQVHCRNYRSTTDSEIRHLVESQIKTEISKGNYMICKSAPKIVSSLGAIPKKSGGVRLIHDCSRPFGLGVNSYAHKRGFKYETVDRAIELLPTGGYMSKVDLSSAYRSVPIHPSCYTFTGLHWIFEGDDFPTYFVDTRLPFGASESPEKFQRCTSAVTRMMAHRGYCVIAYLDDFLVIESDKSRCAAAHQELLSLLQNLGFSINWDKVVGPSQCLTFLGVEINSIKRQLSLPQEKLEDLNTMLSQWMNKKKATKRELQQLIGRLNWAARVVRGGRTFLRRLINLMCSLKRKHHRTRISAETRRDIEWWKKFMYSFNGTVDFIGKDTEPAVYLTSDACCMGGAAVCNYDWLYTNWNIDYPEYADSHINIKELLAATAAADRWKKSWRNKYVVIYTDNTSTMFMINKGTSSNSEAMKLLRHLFWLSAKWNFHLKAHHIPGEQNILSDYISRLHEHKHWQNVLPAYHLYIHPLTDHMSYGSVLYLQDPMSYTGNN